MVSLAEAINMSRQKQVARMQSTSMVTSHTSSPAPHAVTAPPSDVIDLTLEDDVHNHSEELSSSAGHLQSVPPEIATVKLSQSLSPTLPRSPSKLHIKTGSPSPDRYYPVATESVPPKPSKLSAIRAILRGRNAASPRVGQKDDLSQTASTSTNIAETKSPVIRPPRPSSLSLSNTQPAVTGDIEASTAKTVTIPASPESPDQGASSSSTTFVSCPEDDIGITPDREDEQKSRDVSMTRPVSDLEVSK